MFKGLLSFVQDESEKVSDSSFFLCHLNLLSFTTAYDLQKLNRNFQLLAYKRGASITVVNPIDSSFPTHFSFREELLKYVKSREDCHKFSLIYYDENLKEITFIRDLFGLKPFLYRYVEHQYILFSSEISQLLKNRNSLSRNVNLSRISEYLNRSKETILCTSATFFEDIHSLLPGQMITFNKSNIHVEHFLTFDVGTNSIKTKEEYGEEFIHLFKNSVKLCLPSGSSIVGSHLSGGLDSSSVTATIRKLNQQITIHTFYADTDTNFTNEHEYAQEVASSIDSAHHRLVPKNNDIESAYRHISLYGHPDCMVSGSSLNRSIIETAIEYGCDKLFSGHAGDGIVGFGDEYIQDLFLNRQWQELRNLFQSPQYENLAYVGTKKNTVAKTIYSLIAINKNRYSNKQIAQLIIESCRYFSIPIEFFVANGFRKILDLSRVPKPISKYAATSIAKTQTYNLPVSGNNVINSSLYDGIFEKSNIAINEQFYHLDNYYGIQHEYPFYDKKLFELSLQVPAKIKYDFGRRRGHLREAMKGILPEMVRNRTTKANFGLYGRKVALELFRQSRDLLTKNSSIWEFVVQKEFEFSIKQLHKENQALYLYNQSVFNVLKTIHLAIWLDIFHKKH